MQQHQQDYISTNLTPLYTTKSAATTNNNFYSQMRSHSIQVQPIDQFNTAVPQPVNLECKFQNSLNEYK
jgi:hypothetical protein